MGFVDKALLPRIYDLYCPLTLPFTNAFINSGFPAAGKIVLLHSRLD